MSAVFTPRDQVEWRTVKYLERADKTFDYELTLPRPLADWDVYGIWERDRVHSMRDNLTQGDVLFDVGTEQGWCNLVYASMVGPENMVLIEPTREFFPNIEATWEKNYPGVEPLAVYDGLLSDKTTDDRIYFGGWPRWIAGDLIDRNKYQYIHDNGAGIPEMRMDDLVERSGVVPDALTIDVEGAEILVLRGAYFTLDAYRPKVWCSVHPDMLERDYASTSDDVLRFMDNLDYEATHLATDHEQHFMFLPR